MMQEIKFFAMGCDIFAVLDWDHPDAETVLARVPVWFEGWERRFSRFQPTSELSMVNRRAGQSTEVSPVFWEVLQLALAASRSSGGLVRPTLLPPLIAAGYQESFDLLQKNQSFPTRPGGAVTDPDLIELDPALRSVWIPAGMQLDFGGIAKGWAAGQAMGRLSKYGPALVDAGGDIAAGEPRQDGEPWQIGIADPWDETKDLETIGAARMGVATSGTNRRRWQQNGDWQHHLIDPRTNRPAETDVLTATVFAPSVVEAEIGAKTILILGSQAGMDWLENKLELYGMVVLTSHRTIYHSRLEKLRSCYVPSK